MEYEIQIRNYSMYNTEKYYAKDEGDRIANIFDKLIEVADRKCDKYKSDVFWDMLSFNKAVEAERQYDRILVFRETGVSAYETSIIKDPETLTIREYREIKDIADNQNIWRLTHKMGLDETGHTIWISEFKRVYIHITKNI